MQSAYSTFVTKLEESARVHLRRQLEASTSLFTLSNLMMQIEGGDVRHRPAIASPWQNLDLAGEMVDDREADGDNDSDDEDHCTQLQNAVALYWQFIDTGAGH